MIEKRTAFSQVEATESGVVQVRLEKQIVENGVVIAREYHRTSVEPGVPLDAQMEQVNQHLAQMGYPAPAADVITRVRRIVEVEHTQERITEFRARRQRDQERGGSPQPR